MLNSEAMRLLAKDRHESFHKEAKRDRLAREHSSATREERHDRFDVRHLRWLLLRPSGA
jgi:hypothetical protein